MARKQLNDHEKRVKDMFHNSLASLLRDKDEAGDTFIDRLNRLGFFEQGELEKDDDLDERMAARANNDPMAVAHGNVSAENIRSTFEQAALDEILFKQAAAKINKVLKLQGLSQWMPHELRALLLRDMTHDSAKGLPDRLYRGQYRQYPDPLEHGFEGIADRTIRHDGGDPEEDRRIVFVSPEPSVAATYGLKNKYGTNVDDSPINYSDEVYEILTQGLDPTKLVKDDSSVYGELMFGPQYKYLAEIPQEDLDITDQAGNSRRVKRIQKVPYLSDANAKKIKPHIIVKRRF